MAEVLGIISSAITVAQVAGKVGPQMIALKRLWDEVKEIPEEINNLMEELSIYCPMFDRLEDEFEQCHEMVKNDAAAKKSLELCRQAVSELEKLIERLRNEINAAKKGRATLAKVKVVLKKPMIKDHQQRLQRAIRVLTMSQQMYLMAMTRQQPAMIASHLRLDAVKVQEVPVAANSDAKHEDETDEQQVSLIKGKDSWRVQRGSKGLPWRRPGFFGQLAYQVCETADDTWGNSSSQTTYQVRLQLPWWLVQKSWDFQVAKSSVGWNTSIRTWNIVHHDKEIIVTPFSSLNNLQELLSRRVVSLNDRYVNGWTLLTFALLGGNLEVVKFLISLGLHPDYDSLLSSASSVEWIVYDYMWSRPEFVTFVLEYISPDMEPKPTASDFWRINWGFVDPRILLESLYAQGVSASSFRGQLPKDGRSSLKGFLDSYFRGMFWNIPAMISDWNTLARWVFHGADAEEIFRTKWTMILLLNYLFFHPNWKKRYVDLQLVNERWLCDLELAGVDLEALGRMEYRRINRKYRLWLDKVVEGWLEIVSYGPKPEDWQIRFEIDWLVEEFAGEFWRLVEEPWETMPGAWAFEEPDGLGDETDHEPVDDVDHAIWRVLDGL